MGGLKARLRAILEIARAGRNSNNAGDRHLALSLIVRIADQSLLPTEGVNEWNRKKS